jgi:dipeptidase D
MLEQLQPHSVWKYFEQFCAIPHPSGFETRAQQYVVECAAKLGLTAITDTTGNVLIRKKATDKRTGRKTVVLQSHLDMVPQKNAATEHDFKKDPIRPMIDGEWVTAQGTTLGADNGIGVAVALAVLESNSIQHGPIEALFTLDEERGMTGAFGLAEDFLAGRMLINLDTENEDEICIGCAGGTDVAAELPVETEPALSNGKAFTIAIRGLRGGHSGMEIHLNRANALKCMAQVLSAAFDEHALQLASLSGGSARNAIPREAFAEVVIPEGTEEQFSGTVAKVKKDLIATLTPTDNEFSLSVTETTLPRTVITSDALQRLLTVLNDCPYGVQKMSDTVPDMVETSNNLSAVATRPESIRIDCMLRSSSGPGLKALRGRIDHLFKQQGAATTFGSTYPGWQPDPDSSLLVAIKTAHRLTYNKDPEIVAVHAGLECGIIGSKFPGMEMISCGPTIHYAHSPDERMHIASVQRFWKWLTTALEQL